MDVTSLFYRAQPNNTVCARNNSWTQCLEGLSHYCSCCKHDKYDKLKLVLFTISTPKMLWKVIANKLCMVKLCKTNGMDAIIFL